MNKLESIREMRSRSRNVVSVSVAAEIAKPWGLSVDDLPIEHYNAGIDMRRRLDMYQSGSGVSVYELSERLVGHIGKVPATSDKLGKGSMAMDLTFKNCLILEEAISNEDPD